MNFLELIKRFITPRILIQIHIVFSIAHAIFTQGIFQASAGVGSHWGGNTGWQTEIAIFNLGIAAVLICIVRSKKNVERDIIPGLIILNALQAINHLIALIKSPDTVFSFTAKGWLNWGGFESGFIGVLLGSMVYLLSKPSKKDV